jgi:hypothetical protein
VTKEKGNLVINFALCSSTPPSHWTAPTNRCDPSCQVVYCRLHHCPCLVPLTPLSMSHGGLYLSPRDIPYDYPSLAPVYKAELVDLRGLDSTMIYNPNPMYFHCMYSKRAAVTKVYRGNYYI